MKEAQNILRILKETKVAVELNNPKELLILSNQTIHSATVSQDPDNLIVAVLVYSIGKVLQREHYKELEGWITFYRSLTKNLSLAITSLEKDNLKNCRVYLGRIRNSLNNIDGDLRIYIKDIFKKAEINKAFKLYEHGISSEQTAEVLGINLWDLASYIGQSSISNAKIAISIPVEKRIKIAEDIFR